MFPESSEVDGMRRYRSKVSESAGPTRQSAINDLISYWSRIDD